MQRDAHRARPNPLVCVIEDDVVVLDTETTGLSVRDNKLIEISAARLRGREVVERFQTFVHPGMPIPDEITKLTGITNADVADAPAAEEAVAALEGFVQGAPVIAHNAVFDRSFIESVKGGVRVSDIWIDSLALSRIALPRLASHKLSTMAELFGCAAVSHRASDDVDALCGVWRILLCALSDLPGGLMRLLADMHPDVSSPVGRIFFPFLAGADPDSVFSLPPPARRSSRPIPRRSASMPTSYPCCTCPRAPRSVLLCAGRLVNRMYPSYEPRREQIEMAAEVRDALASSTHRVIEAGTGVGKSMAYLVPLAEAARRNKVTVGIATKSNNLADQLMNQELPETRPRTRRGAVLLRAEGVRSLSLPEEARAPRALLGDPYGQGPRRHPDGDRGDIRLRVPIPLRGPRYPWDQVEERPTRGPHYRFSGVSPAGSAPSFRISVWFTARVGAPPGPMWWSPIIPCSSATWRPADAFSRRFVIGSWTRRIRSRGRRASSPPLPYRPMTPVPSSSAWAASAAARWE